MTWQQEYRKEETTEMVQIRNDQSLNYTVTLGVGRNALCETAFVKIWKLRGRRGREKSHWVNSNIMSQGWEYRTWCRFGEGRHDEHSIRYVFPKSIGHSGRAEEDNLGLGRLVLLYWSKGYCPRKWEDKIKGRTLVNPQTKCEWRQCWLKSCGQRWGEHKENVIRFQKSFRE